MTNNKEIDPRDNYFKTGEEDQETKTQTEASELDIAPKKIQKKLKGLHIEEDVLRVFEREQENRERGWGSQIVSDWMREKFVQYGLFEKHNIKNLKEK